jgi:hypothetical protein
MDQVVKRLGAPASLLASAKSQWLIANMLLFANENK